MKYTDNKYKLGYRMSYSKVVITHDELPEVIRSVFEADENIISVTVETEDMNEFSHKYTRN